MILSEKILYDLNVFGLHQLGWVEFELILVLFEFLPKAVLLDLCLVSESSQQVYLLQLFLD